MGLPRVFFDLNADGQPVGRLVIEVCSILLYNYVNFNFFNFADLKNVVMKEKNGRKAIFLSHSHILTSFLIYEPAVLYIWCEKV